jgi:predicted small lipoprotein YifL
LSSNGQAQLGFDFFWRATPLSALAHSILLVSAAFSLALTLTLAGCGQTGPLFLPDADGKHHKQAGNSGNSVTPPATTGSIAPASARS